MFVWTGLHEGSVHGMVGLDGLSIGFSLFNLGQTYVDPVEDRVYIPMETPSFLLSPVIPGYS